MHRSFALALRLFHVPMHSKHRWSVCLLAAAALAAGCGGGSVTLTPAALHGSTASSKPSAKPAATASPSPSPSPSPASSTGTLTATQINAALSSVATYYATLSHGDVGSDTAKVLAFLKTQPAFVSATANPGGITAQLSDGRPAVFFTDRFDDEVAGTARTYARIAAAPIATAAAHRQDATIAAGPHTLAYLVNDDGDAAFVPSVAGNLASAYGHVYGASYTPVSGTVSLENLEALDTGTDVLYLATHGLIEGFYGAPASAERFFWDSTTKITDETQAQYSGDYGTALIASQVLDPGNPTGHAPAYAFSPQFVAEHVKFTPGALLLNAACFGQYVQTLPSVTSTLFGAGVGAYLGWTKSVIGRDEDESEFFLADRTLGEQSPSKTGLQGVITQRTPPQRPFSLDETLLAMQTKTRDDPVIEPPSSIPYAQSVQPTGPDGALPDNDKIAPASDGPIARFVLSTSDALNGGPIATGGVLPLGIPSIEFMTIDESQKPAVLTIYGEFPAAPGHVYLSPSQSSNPTADGSALTVTSWSQGSITAELADEGATAAGYVSVVDQDVPGNLVPLTQWPVTINLSQAGTIGSPPAGSENVAATFSEHIRADVHFYYPQPESTYLPTNFAFQAEQDGTGSITSVTGSASFPQYTLSYAKGSGSTFVVDPTNTAPENFALGSIVSGNAPQWGCNGGGQGGPGDPTFNATSCVQFYAVSAAVASVECSDVGNSEYCESLPMNPLVEAGGVNTTVYGFGSVMFTLNGDYSVGVTQAIPGTDPPGSSFTYDASSTTSTYSFKIGTPIAPPVAGMTPALRRR